MECDAVEARADPRVVMSSAAEALLASPRHPLQAAQAIALLAGRSAAPPQTAPTHQDRAQ